MTPTKTAVPTPIPPAANQHPILRMRSGGGERRGEGAATAVEIDQADTESAAEDDACRRPRTRPVSLHPADLLFLRQSTSCIRLRGR